MLSVHKKIHKKTPENEATRCKVVVAVTQKGDVVTRVLLGLPAL